MGFKKWLGGDKPVTQFSFNLLIIYLTCFFCVYTIAQMILGNYLTNKEIEQMRKNAKVTREIREDQNEIIRNISDEVDRLRVKIKECQK